MEGLIMRHFAFFNTCGSVCDRGLYISLCDCDTDM